MTGRQVVWPEIPSVAWRRPMGQPCPDVGHPRVDVPMIDDGPWAGIPIGGLGTGSIGRTHRGDFARWHLEVGRHRFSPVAADAFSVFVGRPGEPGTATVLSTLRPEALPDWGWTLPEGAGTYHALFPRAWQASNRASSASGSSASSSVRSSPATSSRAPCRSGHSSGGSRTRARTR